MAECFKSVNISVSREGKGLKAAKSEFNWQPVVLRTMNVLLFVPLFKLLSSSRRLSLKLVK